MQSNHYILNGAKSAHHGRKGRAVTVLPSLKKVIAPFLAVQKARTWWAARRPQSALGTGVLTATRSKSTRHNNLTQAPGTPPEGAALFSPHVTEDRHRVVCELGVRARQRQPFHQRLCNEQAVEGVFVVWRKSIRARMFPCPGRSRDLVDLFLSWRSLFERQPKRQLTQGAFDLDFPNADEAQEEFRLRVLTQIQDARREFPRAASHQRNVCRVQQKSHSSPNQKLSGNGASKSSARSRLGPRADLGRAVSSSAAAR